MPNGDHPPLMHWDLSDFLQCLEVEPVAPADAAELHYCTFAIERDGLKLLLTIADARGDVRFSLYRCDGGSPLVDLVMTQCPGVKLARREGIDCLEFASGKLYDRSLGFDDQYLIDFGVRVSVHPDIRLECFESSTARQWPLLRHLEP